MRKAWGWLRYRLGQQFPGARAGPLACREPVLLCCFWLWLLGRDANGFLAMSLAASVLHELCHVLVYRLLTGRWPELFVGFTGICMHTGGQALPLWQELWVTAAGPAGNGLLALLCWGWMQQRTTVRRLAWLWANLLLGGFNLLPVPPLDGWHLLWLLGQALRRVGGPGKKEKALP